MHPRLPPSAPSRASAGRLRLALLLPFAALLPPPLPAAAPPPSGPAAAEAEWDLVARLRRQLGPPPRPSGPSVPAAPADRAAADRRRRERERRAFEARELARAARGFLARHGSHPRAAESAKLAILSDLEGILPRDPRHAADARAAAEAYRRNPRHPVPSRIEVALALERREVARRTLGRTWHARPLLAETALDRLRGEFGERAEVWSAFLSVAEGAPCDAGRELAHRVAQAPSAPAPLRASAQLVLERHALLRRPPVVPVTPAGGQPTPLWKLARGRTVVCLYDAARHPLGPPGLHGLAERPPAGVGWIYLALGKAGSPPRGARPRPRPAGLVCSDPAGWHSQAVEALRINQLPYVVVLDDRMRVSGYGRIEEIPDLLAGIGRPVLP